MKKVKETVVNSKMICDGSILTHLYNDKTGHKFYRVDIRYPMAPAVEKMNEKDFLELYLSSKLESGSYGEYMLIKSIMNNKNYTYKPSMFLEKISVTGSNNSYWISYFISKKDSTVTDEYLLYVDTINNTCEWCGENIYY